MNEKLLIIGASGHGRVAADIALKLNQWESISFLDDDSTLNTSLGLEVIGKIPDASKYINDHDFFIAIGNNSTRKKVQELLEPIGANIISLIHPSAIISTNAQIGQGSVIMAGVVINCCSTIGKGCIINTGATLDHDNNIGDYCHISPGSILAGTVNVGEESWLGAGSIIINNVSIAGDCIIGAGAVVINNVVEKGTYVGVPARRVK